MRDPILEVYVTCTDDDLHIGLPLTAERLSKRAGANDAAYMGVLKVCLAETLIWQFFYYTELCAAVLLAYPHTHTHMHTLADSHPKTDMHKLHTIT